MGDALGERLVTGYPVESIDLASRTVNRRWSAETIVSTIPWTIWPGLCRMPEETVKAVSRLRSVARPRKWAVRCLAIAAALVWRREGYWVRDVLHGFKGWTRSAFDRMEPPRDGAFDRLGDGGPVLQASDEARRVPDDGDRPSSWRVTLQDVADREEARGLPVVRASPQGLRPGFVRETASGCGLDVVVAVREASMKTLPPRIEAMYATENAPRLGFRRWGIFAASAVLAATCAVAAYRSLDLPLRYPEPIVGCRFAEGRDPSRLSFSEGFPPRR